MPEFLVDGLATFRLTRLISTDTFPPVEAAREAFLKRHTNERIEDQNGAHSHFIDSDSWAELVSCNWCASYWVALGVLAARALFPRAWGTMSKALALSAVAGLLSEWSE